jgi:hypothetical protein
MNTIINPHINIIYFATLPHEYTNGDLDFQTPA